MIHINSMMDDDGKPLEFTEKHEGRLFRYRVKLNQPVGPGGIYMGSHSGWKDGLIQKVPGSENEYVFSFNHSPSAGTPTRRVEIYRLPHGAKLLSTTPADLPHRVLEDGRV